MKYIVLYTDGSCNAKSRLGGYGALLRFYKEKKILQEIQLQMGYSNTTISRMELLAIIEGLHAIKVKDKYKVVVISDSQYTVNSIVKGWVFRWRSEGFVGRKNADLWQQFLSEYSKFSLGLVTFIHTRGHGKGLECYQEGNNIADKLADYKQFESYIPDEEEKV